MLTILNVIPIGKPRMTQRDKWDSRPCVVTYWAFCDMLRLEVKRNKLIITNSFKVIFYLPIPESYKKRESYEGRIHNKKFDIDNLCKGLMDSLYQNDSSVHHVEMDKFYSLNPRIEIEFL